MGICFDEKESGVDIPCIISCLVLRGKMSTAILGNCQPFLPVALEKHPRQRTKLLAAMSVRMCRAIVNPSPRLGLTGPRRLYCQPNQTIPFTSCLSYPVIYAYPVLWDGFWLIAPEDVGRIVVSVRPTTCPLAPCPSCSWSGWPGLAVSHWKGSFAVRAHAVSPEVSYHLTPPEIIFPWPCCLGNF